MRLNEVVLAYYIYQPCGTFIYLPEKIEYPTISCGSASLSVAVYVTISVPMGVSSLIETVIALVANVGVASLTADNDTATFTVLVNVPSVT